MPKKIGRLGLGESPWECVRERGFKWEREGRGKRQKGGGAKKAGCEKGRARKSGAPLPQPVILAQYNQPESGAPPSHQ